MNKPRETIFANQKKLGVIPRDTMLTPWPDGLLKSWDKLDAESKKLFIRQAEVHAAYLAYTDHEIGRVIQAVLEIGKLDNTLVIYISGDNGASAEGMINAFGGRFGGYGHYLLKGKPVHVWNALGLKEVRWEAPNIVAAGNHTLQFDFEHDGLDFVTLAFNNISGIGRPAELSQSISSNAQSPFCRRGMRASTSARTR